MMTLRVSVFRKALYAFVLTAALPASAQTQETRIPLNQAPNAVEQLLAAGEFAAAREIALAAVKADPSNPIFLIVLARAEASLGNNEIAIVAARTAWRNAISDNNRFVAAKIVAKAQFDSGNFTRSQIWLRRARQFAPDAASAAQVADDYRTVSGRNPWTTNLRFGVRPSSNINDGSSSATTLLFGFPFEFELSGDARALSGLEVSAGFDTRYRLSADAVSATYLIASFDTKKYVLSDAAKRQAPNVSASDYATDRLSFGVSHKRILREGSLPTEFTFFAVRSWLGGELQSFSYDSTVQQSWDIGSSDRISLSLSNESTSASGKYLEETRLVHSHSFGVATSWAHIFANNNRGSLNAKVRKSTSLAPDSDYQSVTLGATYDFAKPVNGMRFGLGLSQETRRYDASIYAPGPREDKSITLDFSINFTDVEYYGFQPVIRMQARRNDSTTDLFDRDYTSIDFDLRSSF